MATADAMAPKLDTDLYPSRQSEHPRVSPRRGPVVWQDWSDGAPLSRAHTEAFERDGFIVLHDVFNAAEVARLSREATQLLDAPQTLEHETLITEPGTDQVRSVFRIHGQNALYRRLAEDARLVSVAEFLLNDAVYLHQSRLNYKPGFRGKEFYWHSDFETWHVEDGMPAMRALSMSILLTENTANNGPLMLIPGSHTQFIACVGETPDNHYKTSLKQQEYGVPDEDSLRALAEDGGIVAPTGPAGTVVIFDCNTMHGSNGNITPFSRSNAFFVYNAVSNRLKAPYGPATPRPEFIAARNDVAALTAQTGSLTDGAS